MNPIRSENGIALIVVLLLLAVMAGLTTGLTLNGQTEISMARNETYYAGARAAAEAGLNRATEQILGNIDDNLMVTKAVPVIGNGPFDLTDEYAYSFEILDDDDPQLYNGVALTGPKATVGTQLNAMNENGDPDDDDNMRMIIRATATGPRGTTVTIARILETVANPDLPSTTTINPAILVNGDLEMGGNVRITGSQGNVHANGDVNGDGNSYDIDGNLTATGELTGNTHADGLVAGGMPPIPVPEIKVSDYTGLATHKLTAAGTMLVKSGGAWVACSGKGADSCPVGWTFSGGTWSASGSMPTSGLTKSTYWVEGNVEIHGTGKSSETQISVLAEGNMKLTGNGKFKPGNDSKIQFVTNGDFEMGGSVDADDLLDMDGQIMVREQMKIYGNSEFQGRVMVEDRQHGSNVYDAVTNPNGNRSANSLSANDLSGNMTVTYNGSLGGITVTIPGGPDTYTNTISGWIEQ
jgi:predicted acyltransferase (DUF342 family)